MTHHFFLKLNSLQIKFHFKLFLAGLYPNIAQAIQKPYGEPIDFYSTLSFYCFTGRYHNYHSSTRPSSRGSVQCSAAADRSVCLSRTGPDLDGARDLHGRKPNVKMVRVFWSSTFHSGRPAAAVGDLLASGYITLGRWEAEVVTLLNTAYTVH